MSDTPFSDKAKAQPEIEEVEERELSPEEQMELEQQEFFDRLKETYGEGAPSSEQLDAWKEQAGRVRWIELGPEEIYFFRGFRTAEYKGWIDGLRQLAEKDPEKADELLKQKVVARCTMFPKIDEAEVGKLFAGTLDTLYQQIRLASNFIPYEAAVSMVREW